MEKRGIDAYTENQVVNASPGKLILLLYDHVIKCLKNSDMRGASKGLVELMSSLDLDYHEISGRLFSLYEYCLDLVKKGDFDQALKIISEMRQTWVTALDRMAEKEGSQKDNSF